MHISSCILGSLLQKLSLWLDNLKEIKREQIDLRAEMICIQSYNFNMVLIMNRYNRNYNLSMQINSAFKHWPQFEIINYICSVVLLFIFGVSVTWNGNRSTHAKTNSCHCLYYSHFNALGRRQSVFCCWIKDGFAFLSL